LVAPPAAVFLSPPAVATSIAHQNRAHCKAKQGQARPSKAKALLEMKKFINKLEEFTGIDIDGDGKIGDKVLPRHSSQHEYGFGNNMPSGGGHILIPPLWVNPPSL